MLLFSYHCCKKPDSGAAPVQRLPVRTRGLWSLRGERPLLLRWRSHRTEDPYPPCQCPVVPSLSPQTADSSAWWTEEVPAPGEWRSLTRAPGAPSVMMAGTWTMPAWCAGSWAVEMPSMPWGLLILGQDQGASCWTHWTAEERNPTCGSALPRAGECTTAVMRTMQESSAQVWSVYCPVMAEEKCHGSWCLITGAIGYRWARKDWDRHILPECTKLLWVMCSIYFSAVSLCYFFSSDLTWHSRLNYSNEYWSS